MDTERATCIKNSPDWQAICAEIDLWIQIEMDKLRSCSQDDLSNIQIKINTLEQVKSLPTIVIERLE